MRSAWVRTGCRTRAARPGRRRRRRSSAAPPRRRSGCWSGSSASPGLSSRFQHKQWRSAARNRKSKIAAVKLSSLSRRPAAELDFALLLAASPRQRRRFTMPFLVLQFPAFDPVLVTIGPFPIRWYALAYIVGILLGWLYARALIRNERLWGGPAPLTLVDFDDFILWVTLGIILGGRTGYVLFYNPAHFLDASDRGRAAVEGRHVVPRRLHRLRAGGRAVRAAARHLDPVARRPHLRGRHDRAVSRPHRQFHQRRAVGSPDRCALGYGVSGRRAVAAPSEPALRGRARRAGAVHRALAVRCAPAR